jgi:hypothetical protein
VLGVSHVGSKLIQSHKFNYTLFCFNMAVKLVRWSFHGLQLRKHYYISSRDLYTIITLNLDSDVAVILVTVNVQVSVHYTQCDYKIRLNT